MTTHRAFAFGLAAVFVGGVTPLNARAALPLPRHFVVPLRHASAPRAVGSANTTTADAPVGRPPEAPCVAPLFTNAQFSQYAAQTFAYAPPVNCPGPYAKIVFNGNFGVSAGIQFDRTAAIEIGNVPIFFGTTAEPSPNLAPSWHVERDVTDEAALLVTPSTTEADIFNIVDSTYTGVISGTAFLQFYPAQGTIRAAATPDVVLPFPGVAGGPQHIPGGVATPLIATYTLPKNVQSVYLDVYAQSQSTDEQYFNCAPTDVATELFACPNGPLRETEVTIDGIPAGIAPVTPWIYTGGLDPYLWFPLPGAQTLEFKPYRINLTPFAGLLASGQPHTLSLTVDNADNYFQAIGTLLAFEDHGSTSVTGAVTSNTLVANPPATTVEKLSGSPPSVQGTITVTSNRGYAISGYVKTSKGRITTTVDGSLLFANRQNYSNESATTGTLTMSQNTAATTVVTTVSQNGSAATTTDAVTLPLTESLAVVLDSTGTGTQVSALHQRFVTTHAQSGRGGIGAYATTETNDMRSGDTLDILNGQFITGNTNQSSAQTFTEADSGGFCYARTIAAANNVVTSISGPRCGASAVLRH